MPVIETSRPRTRAAFGLSVAIRVAIAIIVCLGAVAAYTVWRDLQADQSITPAAQAEQGLIDAIKKDPSAAAPRIALAEAYLATYRFDDAIKSANIGLSIDKSMPHGYLIRGLAYLNKSDYASAQKNLDQVVTLLKDNPMARVSDDLQQALFYLGVIYYRQKSWDKAMQYLQASLVIQPASSDTLYLVGDMYLKKNAPDLAIQALERAVAYDPKFVPAQFDLGKAYLKVGQKTLAAEHFRLAWEDSAGRYGNAKIELNKLGSVSEHLAAGKALLAGGKLKEALKELELAIALDPISLNTNFALGQAYERMSREAKTGEERLLRLSMAHAMYDRVKKASPAYPGVDAALARTVEPSSTPRPKVGE
jgi:tetratricopeptide (TPR) repeat protein